MQNMLETDRLRLTPLAMADVDFILVLVNTPGWIRFIGDRNIKDGAAAADYVRMLIDSPNIQYWVATLKAEQTPIGVVTFIKRSYLAHSDLGFAFLPAYAGMGYAKEAATALLDWIATGEAHPYVLATTIPDNTKSIQLLERLGFRFDKTVQDLGEKLSLYALSADQWRIDRLVNAFFSVFSNVRPRQPDWGLLERICLPEVVIVKKTAGLETVYNLDTFVAPRRKILSDGSLIDFEEKETAAETKIVGNIAQRYSTYQKCGVLNGNRFEDKGHKFFQFVKTGMGWKISAVIWEDE